MNTKKMKAVICTKYGTPEVLQIQQVQPPVPKPDELLIKIFDFAENVDLDSIQSRDLDDIRPGGLGVHIIHQVMDSVEYKNQPGATGNVLEMRKKLNKQTSCSVE